MSKLTVTTCRGSPLSQMLEALAEEERKVKNEDWVEYLVCYLDLDAKVEEKDDVYKPKNVFAEVTRLPSLYAAQQVAKMVKARGLKPVILTLHHSHYEFLYEEEKGK